MTIAEAIALTASIRGGQQYSQELKIMWLSRLDGRVFTEILSTHEDCGIEQFPGYDKNTPIDTELLVPHPYDAIYTHWLEANIDYANREYDKYNNSIEMFNTDYSAYANLYNRTHMPSGGTRRFLF